MMIDSPIINQPVIIHRLSISLWKSSNLPLRSAPWLPPPTFWRPFLAPGADGDDPKTAQMWVIDILIEWSTGLIMLNINGYYMVHDG